MNMSYCRFRNTLNDLSDCYDNINENLSGDESRARKRLVEICRDIVAEYDDSQDED